MVRFLAVVLILAPANLFFWWQADRRLRPLRLALAWRALLAIFAVLQLSFLTLDFGPTWWAALAYIWNILLLPFVCLALLTVEGWRWFRSGKRSPDERPISEPSVLPALTRRQVLAGVAVAAPPLICLAATARAGQQEGAFRLRRIKIELPQLPPDLDGLTIAHVTDLHIGRFMPYEITGPIADAINALDADVIAFCGDLLDTSERRVQLGIDFIRKLQPRHGLVMIEGNHDVMHDAMAFERPVKQAGLPLLLDESMTFRIPGRATPVQFLGITWGELKTGAQLHRRGRERKLLFRDCTEEARAASVRRVAAMREPGAFPILLAHHPHAFDDAAEAGLPLVLSGHTHGGQIMLTEHIGAGPLRFRYWTGLYRKPQSQLFISNGIGSWFPLRVNAPSEIVHITLTRSHA